MLLTVVSRAGRFERIGLSALLGLVAMFATPSWASFVTFESGQVRPLALSPDGSQLFAVNTPDDRLEIFDVDASGLTHVGSVQVGLEPVAVAARTNGEVWVVNHLSDSVSIVDVAATPPRVVRTLLVGDEPRDIVFAGAAGTRAFITTARRGQNVPSTVPPLLTTPTVPRALVWAFDATNLGDPVSGTPLKIIELFGDTPRALAASPDGSTVYAAVFHSGNQTTAVSEGVVCNDTNLNNNTPQGPCTVFGASMPGGLPNPEKSADGVPRPETGLIVKWNNGVSQWRDQLNRNWNNAVKFNLPDYDVFKIDADATPPAQIGPNTAQYAHVGTILFNMIVNPANDKVYVTNTDAINEVRFEGPGMLGGSTVRGHLHEARVTVLDGSSVLPRHLNKHITYSTVPSPMGTAAKSLATPVGMAVDSTGATLYVTGFGSQKIGVYDTTKLENNTFDPDTSNGVSYVGLAGGGPSGLVLDENNDRLYVLTRFDNSVRVVNTLTQLEETALKQSLHNPEPPNVVTGRPFLYDAVFTSSNGEASCSSCHVFGDFDSLAWDLGNPDDIVLNNPNPFRVPDVLGTAFPDHHPIKGPMTTQSLRGMANHGPMHWRGDRTGGNDPGGDPLDETQAFLKFNIAFDGLLGRGGPIPDPDMAAFAAFILDVTYPPNPIRALDNSLTADEDAGRTFFFGGCPPENPSCSPQVSDVFEECNGCHVLNPAAGFFGSDGLSSFENEPQNAKIPHLRNLYQKVGMFGMPAIAFVNQGDNGNKGDQIRGFGFLHDGSIDTVFRFHNASVFNQNNPGGFPIFQPGGFPNGAPGDPLRRQVEAFMLAFDSNMAPIVGQQATLVSAALGTTHGLAAKKMIIKDNLANDESKRSIMVQSKDAAIAIPAPGSSDDPRCGSDPPGTVKASITVASIAAGQTHTSNLPCENWSTMGPDAAPTGYKYRDPELDSGTVNTLIWKAGNLLKVVFKGKGTTALNYNLQLGVAQGTVGAQLQSGGAKTCLQCQATDGHDGSDGRKFLGKGGDCSVPSACAATGGGGPADSRVTFLIQRAEVVPPECDLIVKGTLAGEARGWYYDPVTNHFISDRDSETPLTDVQLRQISSAAGQALTYTCVPPGNGVRAGVDRDEDGFFDRTEIDAGSDPSDPLSTP